MKKSIVVLFLWLPIAGIIAYEIQKGKEQESKSVAKFLSPTEYQGPGGSYRWNAKVDEEKPSKTFDGVTTEDVAGWDDLEGNIHRDSGRQDIELKWFELLGKVVLVKCEEDGDLHIQLADEDGKGVNVVCEVPAGKPWDKIREQVFGWSKTKFPCKPHTLDLVKAPIIRVKGKAFWDGEHHGKTPNRRDYDENVTVWEIHPVMALEEVK